MTGVGVDVEMAAPAYSLKHQVRQRMGGQQKEQVNVFGLRQTRNAQGFVLRCSVQAQSLRIKRCIFGVGF